MPRPKKCNIQTPMYNTPVLFQCQCFTRVYPSLGSAVIGVRAIITMYLSFREKVKCGATRKQYHNTRKSIESKIENHFSLLIVYRCLPRIYLQYSLYYYSCTPRTTTSPQTLNFQKKIIHFKYILLLCPLYKRTSTYHTGSKTCDDDRPQQ